MRVRNALCAGLALLSSVAADVTVAGEPVPLPSADYAAEGSFAGGGKMVMRHHGGLMRLDLTMPGAPGPMTGYFDLPAKKALMVVATPAGRMAMEVDLAAQVGYGAMVATGTREGQDTVAGEPCDIWRIDTGRAAEPVHACITADGITLRTDTVAAGKPIRVFEVASLSRAAQDAGRFRMPTDVPVMRLPLPSPIGPKAPPAR